MAYSDWTRSPYVPQSTISVGNRLDHRRGRFTVDYETNQINAALRGHQTVNGDYVDYYRFDGESTVVNIYDEADGVGKVFAGPLDLQVLHVLTTEGAAENRDGGIYYVDGLHVTCLFDHLQKVGLTKADLEHQKFLRDRVAYNDKVYKVTKIDVLGQLQRRDIIVTIEAEQIRSDELIGDQQFARYSA